MKALVARVLLCAVIGGTKVPPLRAAAVPPLRSAEVPPLRAAAVPPPRSAEVLPLREVSQIAPLEIPLPSFDTLEPVVAEQLREARRALEALTSAPGASGGELARAYGALARVCHAYELFDAAEPLYRQASRHASDEATWPHLLGYLYQQTGRLAQAAEQFERTLRLDPTDHAAAVRLAQVLLGANRLREARERFDSLVDVFPALAQQGLGEIALREGRYGRALDHLRAALARVPDATSLHYSIAMALRGLAKMDEAREQLEKRGSGGIIVGDPIVDALRPLVRGERGLIARGKQAYDAGRYHEAGDAFRAALVAAPDSMPARINLALALVRQGRDADAVEHLRVVQAAMPDDRDVQRELIAALLRLRRPAEAIELLGRAAAANPDDEDLAVSLALVLAGQSRYGEAVTVLAGAHRRNADRPTTMTTLARLLSSSPDRAVRNGTRALELATTVWKADDSAVSAETMALALAELERCTEARQWMQRALGLAEKSGDAAEQARLRAQLPRFEVAICRAP
jgi:tetratricopeptide (TPR) repeat protein